MYFKLFYGTRTATIQECFEARSEKEAVSKTRRKIVAAIKRGEYVSDYHGPAKLYYYGPGEFEVWKGTMWYAGTPKHEQMHAVAF